MKEFVVAANDTNLKAFHILEQQSVFTIHNAHSDNVKKVRYLGDSNGSDDSIFVISASADKTVKLWDLRNSTEPLSTLKLSSPIEDFCFLPSSTGRGIRDLIVANGSMLTIARLGEARSLEKIAEY